MALRAVGVDVVLADPSRTTVLLARDLGAGRLPADGDESPRLVVVAAPPDVTADVVLAELAAYPDAVVTDVASVKSGVLEAVTVGGGDLARYIGSHPMAGSERSGPTAARPDLFVGRPWVITPGPQGAPAAIAMVRALAVDAGATPVDLDADRHDAAVALISHLPQVVASLVAARLNDADPAALDLAGQGLRDVTRIAASDPAMWTSILAANAGAVAPVLRGLRADLDTVLGALDDADGGEAPTGALGALAGAIAAGNTGVARIPGKHGGSRRDDDVVVVIVPDRPGELARLLVDMGEVGINLEDLGLEHAPRQAVGLASLSVAHGSSARLITELTERGWKVAG